MRVLLLVAALMTALVTPAQAGKLHVVVITDSGFSPKHLEIKKYDRVRWEFRGTKVMEIRKGLDPARPCKAMGGPDSGPRKPGQSYTYRFKSVSSNIIFENLDGCDNDMMSKVEVNDR